MARAKLPERLERLGAALEKEKASPAAVSAPDGRRDGKSLYQVLLWGRAGRPSTPALYSPLRLGLGMVVACVVGVMAFLRSPPATLPPAPANTSAHCQVSPPARLLAPLEEASPKHALFQETVVEPAARVSLKVLNGPEVLTLAAPQPGDDCKIDLPAGLYRWEETYPNGAPEGRTLLLVAGGNERDTTHHYVHSAPMDPDLRNLFRMLNPEDGPTVLFRGPLLLQTALWDATAGAVVIAPHGSRCRGPTRPLPPPSGDYYNPFLQLDDSEDLCAIPTVNAPAGFGVHVNVVLKPRPLPKAVDPAKRFVFDRTIKGKPATPLLLQGPLLLTGGSWDETDGLLGVADGRCHDNLSDIFPGGADFPCEVEKGRSVCVEPDSLQPGGTLTVHLEGYRP
jgi:hypothetical protein